MKDISTQSSPISAHMEKHKLDCQRHSETTNALPVSDDSPDILEPFKLSMLNSPVVNSRPKNDLQDISAFSSPFPELAERMPLFQERKIHDGKSHNLDLFLDAMLRKREGCAPETEPLLEYKLNSSKQLHRVKYYWRGTSLNYPFTYMRMKLSGSEVAYEEDYSHKRVNPNEGLFN